MKPGDFVQCVRNSTIVWDLERPFLPKTLLDCGAVALVLGQRSDTVAVLVTRSLVIGWVERQRMVLAQAGAK